MSHPQPAADRPSDTAALILGILAALLWLLPIAGLPISICGLVQGLRAWRATRRRKALTGLILSSLGLLLALSSSAAGLYLGLHVPRAQ